MNGNVDWYTKMNEIVDLTLSTKEILEKGSIQAKRNILSKLGSNLVWNDKEVSIYNSKAVNKLVEGIKSARSLSHKFEPKNCVVNKSLNEKTDAFSPVFSTMLRTWDNVRKALMEESRHIETRNNVSMDDIQDLIGA